MSRPTPQFGDKNPKSKLNEDAVRRIRAVAAAAKASGEVGWKIRLAGEYGISLQGIYRVVSGEAWGHVR